ncbi:MAG: isoprenylcysteine carboxylmethyltransferase family protein [Methanomicrobiales archaeon]|nr:isoprenylcysteine carboxylmethyltransferase family protein [Methanomicrobiales archaeon]
MDDLFWKGSYLVLFVIWLGIRGYYRRDAVRQETKEKAGWGPDSLFLALNFIGMTFLPVITVLLPYLDGFAFSVSDPIRFAFLLLFALNLWLFVAAHRDLGKNWSMALEIKEGHHLVRNGIYTKIRHPMYAHFWIFVIAQGFVLANALVLVFGVLAWGLLYVHRVPKEEEMLIAEFGDEYREYMKETGRVIPKF